MDTQAESRDDAEIALHENTLNATYIRVLNEIVAAKNPELTLGAEEIPTLKATIHLGYHQCVFHAQRWLELFPDASGVRVGTAFRGTNRQRIMTNPFAPMVDENPFRGKNSTTATLRAQTAKSSATGPITTTPPPCGSNRNCSATTNPCGLQYTPYEDMFSGMDSIILIGDSTVLRVFKFLQQCNDIEYRLKVADLANPHIWLRLRMSNGREIQVHFFRLLYASMAPLMFRQAFKVATVNSLIFASLGPHDTSWLIFDKATFNLLHVMPGMVLAKDADRRSGKKIKQSEILRNNVMRAKAYWIKNAAFAAHALATELQEFEQRQRAAAAEVGRTIVPGEPLRPFVIFREQLLPKCSDPKYANKPHTRCLGLLRPILVPFMRDYLRAMLTAVNIPTIGIDTVSGRAGLPCHLVDAGHLPRPCKTIELAIASYGFRMARRLRLVQGYPITASDSSVYGQPPSLEKLIKSDGGITWQHLSRRVTHLRPLGVVHPNEFVRANQNYQSEAITIPQPSVYSADEWLLLSKFDDPALVERAVSVSGGGVRTSDIIPGRRKGNFSEGGNSSANLGDMMNRDTAATEKAKKALGEDREEVAAVSKEGVDTADGSDASSAVKKSFESAVDLTKSEAEAALNAVNANTTNEDIDESVMGVSTYYSRYSTQSSPKLGAVAVVSLLALTAVAVLLWRAVEQ